MLDGSSRHTLLLLGRLLARAWAPEPRRRLTNLTSITRPHAHHTRVDGCNKFTTVRAVSALSAFPLWWSVYCIFSKICTAGNAVLHLHVQLRQRVGLEHTGIPHVALAASLDDIAHLHNNAKYSMCATSHILSVDGILHNIQNACTATETQKCNSYAFSPTCCLLPGSA